MLESSCHNIFHVSVIERHLVEQQSVHIDHDIQEREQHLFSVSGTNCCQVVVLY